MIRGLDAHWRTAAAYSRFRPVCPGTAGAGYRNSGQYACCDAQVLDELMGERTDSFLFHWLTSVIRSETGLSASSRVKLVTVVLLWRVLQHYADMDKFPVHRSRGRRLKSPNPTVLPSAYSVRRAWR